MAITKESSPEDIALQLSLDVFSQMFRGGKIYAAVGNYNAAEIALITNSMEDLMAELDDNYDNWEELAAGSDAIVINSETVKFKTTKRQVAGRRNTTISMKLIGLDNAKKSYIESDHFSLTARTFIILCDGDEDDFSILNGLTWIADWKAEVDGLNTLILSSTITGPVQNKILCYVNVLESNVPLEDTEITEVHALVDEYQVESSMIQLDATHLVVGYKDFLGNGKLIVCEVAEDG